MRTLQVLLALSIALLSPVGYAWDPLGDIQNPGRIIRNVERETRNAGRAVDRARLEAQAQAGAPALEQWFHASRNTARSGGVSPIPPNIRQRLEGFFDADVLNRVRFKVGDRGALNLAALSIQYGDAAAVVLIDTVVFHNANDAYNNDVLWAHELRHVQQFRDWGVRDFAIRYLRSWNGVEGEADDVQNRYAQWRNQQDSQQTSSTSGPFGSTFPPTSRIAGMCATPFGQCAMNVPIQAGSQCYCMTPSGPFWGTAQ